MKQPFAYTIKDYQKQKPFSSFLSGVAGHTGIPLWSFYVNRGQLMASFGVTNKNGAIMEFYPANQSYHYVSKIGFRTFVKVDANVYEFFKEKNPNQSLTIRADQVSIEESNESIGIKVRVTYFTLPNEPLAALVRKVDIINLDAKAKHIELVDGLAQILPSGIDYGSYKAISNLLQSWMSSIHESNHIFYKLRATTGDSAEVSDVVDGNFYMTFGIDQPLYISDYKLVFDEDTSLETPYGFNHHTIETLKKTAQTHVNQVPCAMTCASLHLKDQQTFFSLIGYAHQKEAIFDIEKRLNFEVLSEKEVENTELHNQLVEPIETHTSLPLLDAYFNQCYLDNVLRGGTPWVIDTKTDKIGYYLYSRKHGDLERDYNFFHLEPSFFSQGNGNFRDVLQNRRNDIFFEPNIGDFNIVQFGSLIQADGYNPLSIEGVEFSFEGTLDAFEKGLSAILKKPFTPGMVATKLFELNLDIYSNLQTILKQSTPVIKASFGEGYWEDHFTYIYDLVDGYLSVFPDALIPLMFEKTYPFFVSPAKVLPRSQKYVLTKAHTVRQYGALKHWEGAPRWLSNEQGQLKINLFGKLLTLVLNKYGHLDPLGIGLSYEANKPGWNDAANGLPGLFGSGVSESMELLKIVKFLKDVAHTHSKQVVTLLKSTETLAHKYMKIHAETDYDLWDQRMTALENYREQLNQSQHISLQQASHYVPIIELIEKTLIEALDKAKKISAIYPTYLTYEADKYENIVDDKGQDVIGDYGLPLVKVTSFKLKTLPHFLEGPARYLKSHSDATEGKKIYEAVKKTGLYDDALKIYQTSESLDDCSHEIGRLRAFTPGWLERESNFLHMTYKYLLGLLKSGLYNDFFSEIENNYTCFMDPKRYGRSPIENSSFIATSSNPDPKKHGQGFVSRLTGSTAEVLSMWRYMFLGDHLYTLKDNQLIFKLSPKLPKTFFNNGKISFKLFNHTTVTYFNPNHLDTFDLNTVITKIVIHKDGDLCEVHDDHVAGKWARDIREQRIEAIDVYFDKK
ncbi:MAG: cellobiose phosphorylase [Acholeplasmataceae bacterium]